MDDRALANGVLLFGAALLVTAIMVIVLDPVMQEIPIADQCTVDACTTGEGWVQDAWTYYPFGAVFIAFLAFLRAAMSESRGVR